MACQQMQKSDSCLLSC